MDPRDRLLADERAYLIDLVDCALNKGVVVIGELIISVADVDLVYIRLQAVITSIEQASRHGLTGTRGLSAMTR